MEDDRLLVDYDVQEESIIHLVLTIRGCACGCGLYPPQVQAENGAIESSRVEIACDA